MPPSRRWLPDDNHRAPGLDFEYDVVALVLADSHDPFRRIDERELRSREVVSHRERTPSFFRVATRAIQQMREIFRTWNGEGRTGKDAVALSVQRLISDQRYALVRKDVVPRDKTAVACIDRRTVCAAGKNDLRARACQPRQG